MGQSPRTGSLEQILRCLRTLASSPAFGIEVASVVNAMGPAAFQPGPFTDANGVAFNVSLDDEEFGPPAGWIPTSFAVIDIADSLKPIPPYPRLQLFGIPGKVLPDQEIDQQERVTGWANFVDAIVITADDRAEPAQRSALALMDAFERLVRRNPYLGGLVELCVADSSPAPGGPVHTEKSGNVAAALLRFRVETMRSIV